MGAADYMAPEQWADAPEVDFRVDVYALGCTCTLFKLLVGRGPYEPVPTAYQNKMEAHISANVPSAAESRADLPSGPTCRPGPRRLG